MLDNFTLRRTASSEIRLALAGCAAASAVVFLLFRNLRLDDAFITIQFARNVASGRGFVFNAGARVFGATSPLHVFVLAGVYAIAGDFIVPAANLISAVAVGAQAFLLFLLFRRTSSRLGWLMLTVALSGLLGSFEFLPLETNLLAALILAVIWCLQDRRETWCGVFLGLAFLCRYDTVLLVPICAVVWWRETRRIPVRMLGAALLMVTPWLIWSMWYFDTVLPQTFYAKLRISRPSVYFTNRTIEFAKLPWALLPANIGNLLARTTPLFWISGVWLLWRHVRQTMPLLVYGGLLVAVYSWIAPTQTQHWHLYPTEMCSIIAFVMGAVGWLTFDEYWNPSWQPVRQVLAGLAATAILVSGSTQTVLFARSYTTDFWLGHRHDRYVEVSQWLDANIAPGRAVLPLEIGTIGYLSGFTMVDPYGLINATNTFPWSYEWEDLLDIAQRYRADVLVLNSPAAGASFEKCSSFRVVKVFPWDPWSTILVRSPQALIDADSFDRLRADLPDRARAALSKPAQP